MVALIYYKLKFREDIMETVNYSITKDTPIKNYLDCCSDIMRFFNLSTGQHLHDSNEPFKTAREQNIYNYEPMNRALWRLQYLVSEILCHCCKEEKSKAAFKNYILISFDFTLEDDNGNMIPSSVLFKQ